VLISVYSIPVQIALNAPISGLIFGFALWEAWKINKSVHLTFNGPFRVNPGPAGLFQPEVAADGS
jgi:hypothetical protein